jgi:hypothetical protein
VIRAAGVAAQRIGIPEDFALDLVPPDAASISLISPDNETIARLMHGRLCLRGHPPLRRLTFDLRSA